MDEKQKQTLLSGARSHVVRVSQVIFEAKTALETFIARLRNELIWARGEKRDTTETLLYLQLEKQKMLGDQTASPYFFRCEVVFDDEKQKQTLYFGKFPFLSESIYSWVAPVSAIRFESPGRFSYSIPNEGTRTGQLLRKDQFMIVDKKIIFMSTETTDIPRELIYQEYFSQKKTEFVLPEIVEQMEKAQDTIIRSNYFGSFLISGPAGSGKTTLALHKLSYLILSPDTANFFPAKKVVVFVQDALTKKYFGGLLPQLGIHKVKITTFDEWAREVLSLQDIKYVLRFGSTEDEKDMYEYHKNKALKSLFPQRTEKTTFALLQKIYKNHFTEKEMSLFSLQIKTGYMDRFDLTILLKLRLVQNGKLTEKVEKWVKLSNGRLAIKMIQQSIQYAGVILDEAENYLTEQIAIIKSCINAETQAMIYVGDLVQQTLPSTIHDWNEANEIIDANRKITLQKVYRNTKNILEYIQSLGYSVEIPSKLREGEKVEEFIFDAKNLEVEKVASLIQSDSEEVIGILAKSADYLKDYKKRFASFPNVYVLTINEAQGVEFDTEFLVGIDKAMVNTTNLVEEVRIERRKVDRDLIYVALTRAMNKLYVSGKASLSKE